MPDAEIIKTEINSEPAFVTQDIDMIYMGPMPENIQEVAIRKLRPYKEKIEELIKKNVVFLVTGNAVELFGKYIENEDNNLIESSEEKNLIIFCKTPRTRNEICHYLGINSVSYVIKKYVMPLVERGILKMSIPDKPKSTKQLFYCE